MAHVFARAVLLTLPLSFFGCSQKMGAVEDTSTEVEDSGIYDPDADGDGYTESEDCDDDDPNTHPGAEEICDGLDNDCDGVVPPEETDLDADGTVECEEFCGAPPASALVSVLPECNYTPSGSGNPFEVRVEWAMTQAMTDPGTGASIPAYTFQEYPLFGGVFQAPMVGQLTDDNFDGTVSGEDVPDIAVIMNDEAESTAVALRLLSGDGSEVHDSTMWQWHTNAKGTFEYAPFRYAGLALADSDDDGRFEILTLVIKKDDGLCYPAAYEVQQTNGIVTLDLESVYAGMNYICGSHAPSVADIDGDGTAEIIYGRNWIDGKTFAWEAGGYGGRGWWGQAQYGSEAYWNSGYHAFAYDMDGDGVDMEVVAGSTVYANDGSVFCELGSYDANGTWTIARDGYPAVADMRRFAGDTLGEPEIVVTGNEYVSVFHGSRRYDPNGLSRCTMIAQLPNAPALDPTIPAGLPAHPNCDTTRRAFGGQPTVADFDGDGDLEIGDAGACWYSVFQFDENQSYRFERYALAQTKDWSSASTGSTVFDFNADGQAHIVFADEQALYVWWLDDDPGLMPWQRLQEALRDDSHKSWTIHEYPLVADVDGDGKAEIVATNSSLPGWEGHYGLYVLGAADDDWVSARTVWPQHAYYVTNGNEDLSVGYAAPNYEPYTAGGVNSFRQQAPGAFGALAAPNLFVLAEPPCQEGCGDITVYLQVGNEGSFITASTEVPVAIYGVTWAGSEVRTLLDWRYLTAPIGPGQISSGMGFVIEDWDDYDWLVAVVDDPDLVGSWSWGASNECDETDNETVIQLGGLCP